MINWHIVVRSVSVAHLFLFVINPNGGINNMEWAKNMQKKKKPKKFKVIDFIMWLKCCDGKNKTLLRLNTHQEPRGAVQEAPYSGYEASVQKAGELWRNSAHLHGVKLAADDEVLS